VYIARQILKDAGDIESGTLQILHALSNYVPGTKIFMSQWAADYHGEWGSQGGVWVPCNKRYGKDREYGGVGKHNAILFEGIFTMFEIEIRSGEESDLFNNFGVIILQSRPKWNLCDGGEILFFTDEEIPFQPVDAIVMFIVFVVGQLVLDIEKDQDGGCDPNCQTKQV